MIQYFEIDSSQTEAFITEPPAPRLRDYHEIMWVESGCANFIIDGDFFEVEANAFFIIPKDRYHQFLPKAIITGQVVRFSEDFIERFPRNLFTKFNPLSTVKISPTLNEDFTLLFQLIKRSYWAADQNHDVLKHLLKALISKLEQVRNDQIPNPRNSHFSMDLFDRFQALLDEHILMHRKVSFYADLLHTSPRKLSEVTKSVLNNTTEKVIAHRLLIEAKRQLNYTNKTISQIAYDIGFQDNSHFTKFFKTHLAITPKQYRTQIQDA